MTVLLLTMLLVTMLLVTMLLRPRVLVTTLLKSAVGWGGSCAHRVVGRPHPRR